jgi:hypothetical protein
MDNLARDPSADVTSRNERCLDDLPGNDYHDTLNRLHTALNSRTHFEIDIETGKIIALARCQSVTVDPEFYFDDLSFVRRVPAKLRVMFFRTTGDDSFVRFRPDVLLGQLVDFVFLGGMHRCEYPLRDFINTERCCGKNAAFAVHDCLPVELPMTGRGQMGQLIDRGGRIWGQVMFSAPLCC